MSLRFAYNTNGCGSHRLEDALDLMADSGYSGVALTLDHHHFDPFAADWIARAEALRVRLDAFGFGSVIETGARFLLDPRAKHEPTLVTADAGGRRERIAFLERAIDIAAILGSEAMSFWAGVPKQGVDRAEAMRWLVEGLVAVSLYAERRGVVAAFEPEPGMLIETAAEWKALAIPNLKLALDTGHCLVTQDIDPAEAVRVYAADLGTVSLEDMKRGVHLHLPFGAGDMDVPAVLDALEAARFDRLVCVELSRESPQADKAIPASIDWLRTCRAESIHASDGRKP
jgi:sugar phosphate isomerase/epimerase